jgi:hypothetical protein
MSEKGHNPYNKGPEELSVDAIDLILTKDIEQFDNSQIINPEHPSPKKKGEKADSDEGSPWRLTA